MAGGLSLSFSVSVVTEWWAVGTFKDIRGDMIELPTSITHSDNFNIHLPQKTQKLLSFIQLLGLY